MPWVVVTPATSDFDSTNRTSAGSRLAVACRIFIGDLRILS
jgi:hypothetical protein